MEDRRRYDIHLERHWDARVKVTYDRALTGWPRPPGASDALQAEAIIPGTSLTVADVAELMRGGGLTRLDAEARALIGAHLGDLLFPTVDGIQWAALHRAPTDIRLICDEGPAFREGHPPLLRWLPWQLATVGGRPLQSALGIVRLALPQDDRAGQGAFTALTPLRSPRVLARVGVAHCPSGRSREEILRGVRLADGRGDPELMNLEEHEGEPAAVVRRLKDAIAGGTYDVILLHTPAFDAPRGRGPALQIREDGDGAGLLTLSELSAALQAASARRGGPTPVLHIHAPSASVAAAPLFEALSPWVSSLGWTCARWMPEPRRPYSRIFHAPGEAQGQVLSPSTHGISGYLEHLLGGASPPRAQAMAFGFGAVERGHSLAWTRYREWPSIGSTSSRGYYRPEWIARMDREDQHALLVGALKLSLGYGWEQIPAFLWQGEAAQEPETFHQRLKVELETWIEEDQPDFDLADFAVEWPMEGLGGEEGSAPLPDRDIPHFQRRIASEYKAELGCALSPEGFDSLYYGHRTTGTRLLLYLHHTFYSRRSPTEAEINQLMRWWERVLIPAMPETLYPILGIAWVVDGAPLPASRDPGALLAPMSPLVQRFQDGSLKAWHLGHLKQIDLGHLLRFFERMGWPEGWPEERAAREERAAHVLSEAALVSEARSGLPEEGGEGSTRADWRAVADILSGLRPKRTSQTRPQSPNRRRPARQR